MPDNTKTGVYAYVTREEERATDRLMRDFAENWLRPYKELSQDQKDELTHDEIVRPSRPRSTPRRRPRSAPGELKQNNPFCKVDSLGRSKQNEKVTFELSSAAIEGLHEKVLRANAQGLIMSSMLSIVWREIGLHTEASIRTKQQKIFDGIRDMARHHEVHGRRLDTLISWIWVMERGVVNGLHSHVLFSCPPEARTKVLKTVSRAIRKDGKTQPGDKPWSLPAGVHLSDRPIGKLTGTSREPRQQWAQFGYITKSSTISYTADAKARAAGQGRIVGKRCGYSSHILGGKTWRRFTADHGKSENWTRNYLRGARWRYPLLIGRYVGPLWRDGADQPPPKSTPGLSTRRSKHLIDAYPKDEGYLARLSKILKL